MNLFRLGGVCCVLSLALALASCGEAGTEATLNPDRPGQPTAECVPISVVISPDGFTINRKEAARVTVKVRSDCLVGTEFEHEYGAIEIGSGKPHDVAKLLDTRPSGHTLTAAEAGLGYVFEIKANDAFTAECVLTIKVRRKGAVDGKGGDAVMRPDELKSTTPGDALDATKPAGPLGRPELRVLLARPPAEAVPISISIAPDPFSANSSTTVIVGIEKDDAQKDDRYYIYYRVTKKDDSKVRIRTEDVLFDDAAAGKPLLHERIITQAEADQDSFQFKVFSKPSLTDDYRLMVMVWAVDDDVDYGVIGKYGYVILKK